jgi:hypothetical protein
VVVGLTRKGEAVEAELRLRLEQVRVDSARVAQSVTVLGQKAGDVADKASGMIDGYCIASVLLACYALGRNIYVRMTKDTEKKEGVAENLSNLSENKVLKAFDAMALVAILPMLYSSGPKAAFNLWKTLKGLCSMIRDAVSGYHLFGMVFGSKKEDGVPFIGFESQNQVASVVSDLVERLEERVQGVEEEMKSHDSALPAASASSVSIGTPFAYGVTGGIGPDGFYHPAPLPVAEPVFMCPMCHVVGERKDHLHGGATALAERSYSKEQKIAHDGLRKIWTQAEDLVHLNSLKSQCEKKPWLLPVVMLIAFGVLIIALRWREQKKAAKKVTFEKKEAGVKASLPKKPVETQERASHAVQRQKVAASKKKKQRKYEDDYEDDAAQGLSDKGDAEQLIADQQAREDEQAAREEDLANNQDFAMGGKQGVRDAAEREFGKQKNAVNDTMLREGKILVKKPVTAAELEAHVKDVEQHLNHAKKQLAEKSEVKACSTEKCDGKCGLFHNVKKKAAKAVKTAKKQLICKRCKQSGHLPADCKKGKTECWCDKATKVVCDIHFRPHASEKKEAVTGKPAEKKEVLAAGLAASAAVALAAAAVLPNPSSMATKVAVGAVGAVLATVADKLTNKPTVQSEEKYPEKKEALVNGPRFDISKVPNSMGYATVQSDTTHCAMNCTFVWNGMYVSKHIFPKDSIESTEITFHFGDESRSRQRSAGKEIGNDSLWFPRGSAFSGATLLRTALPVVGEKVVVLSYDSVENMKDRAFMQDATVVQSVDATSNAEKAYYAASTVMGSCGAPVVNSSGKVVGFHNFTSSVATGFIPITALMVQKATGSVSTN